MLKEFREFAIKGNMVDLAVGVVIGAAFGKIIDSLVKDVIMPPIGALTGGLDFSNQYAVLRGNVEPGTSLAEAQTLKDVVVLSYGSFVTALLQFLIVAFALFFVVKAINRMRRPDAAAPPEPTNEEKLLTEIRDAIQAKGSV
jgi:large conductance mechanosensitive channel